MGHHDENGIRKVMSVEENFGDDVSILERSEQSSTSTVIIKFCLGLALICFATGCIIYSVINSEDVVEPTKNESHYFPYDLSQHCTEGHVTITNRTGVDNDYDTSTIGASWLQDSTRRRIFHRVGLEANDKDWLYTHYVFINHSFVIDSTGCKRNSVGYDQYLTSLGITHVRKLREEAFKIQNEYVEVNFYEGEPPLTVVIEGLHPTLVRAYSSLNNTLAYGWEYIFSQSGDSSGLFRKEYWYPEMKAGVTDFSVFENIPDICFETNKATTQSA